MNSERVEIAGKDGQIGLGCPRVRIGEDAEELVAFVSKTEYI